MMEKVTCYYTDVNVVEGAPCGTKEEVLAWATEEFGPLEELRDMMFASWFFADNPPRIKGQYKTSEGLGLVIAVAR